jgi:hypothetical protein
MEDMGGLFDAMREGDGSNRWGETGGVIDSHAYRVGLASSG